MGFHNIWVLVLIKDAFVLVKFVISTKINLNSVLNLVKAKH